MKNFKVYANNYTFKRISKKTAEIAYNNDLSVIFCPVKMRPFGYWHPEAIVNKSNSDNDTFQTVLNSFEYYNCNCNEVGKYTAFYIPVKEVDRFTGEAPTEYTLGTVESYDYSFLDI